MNVICPGCGRVFDTLADLASKVTAHDGAVLAFEDYELAVQPDGTAFRPLRKGEERHIDQRLRCPTCAIHQR